ncbi:LysR family transcriptional regulator [Marinobacterium nitratireducens]|uniref:LysR family transcriptional regulator n=1 Tax=Marinobacterium nitratireducens TaxID=518897 RepID=A0A917ZPL3_9GAMM|nr:LysR family transcriptional regulator [Marinobacterium nitratireducens]GGO88117.1 LysR family transcriptional regulator [Marinobacterium nitratireducens]
MTNEQLRAFLAVVDEGSFRGAAASLFKTQSTVSAAVRSLEEAFGFQLFSRDAYRPRLTAEGKAFYRQARHVLGQVQELEALGHRLAKGEAPSLSLSLSAMCASPLWLDTVRHFCGEHPRMRLHLSTQHLSGVLELLRREKVDLAMGPHTGLDDQFEYIEIGTIDMVTVAAPGYLEGAGQRVIPQSELRNRPHILISDTGSLAPFDHVNVLVGGERWYVGDYQVKKELLMAGLGWARIPEHMVVAELGSRQLLALEVENFNSRSRLPIYLIRLRDLPLSELAQAFWLAMLRD